jgi:hypothetical protein
VRPNMAKHVSHHSPMLVAIIGTRDSLDQLRAVNRLGSIRLAHSPLPEPTRNDSLAVVGISPRATRHVPIPLRSEPRLTAHAGTTHLSLRLRIVRESDHIGQRPTLRQPHGLVTTFCAICHQGPRALPSILWPPTFWWQQRCCINLTVCIRGLSRKRKHTLSCSTISPTSSGEHETI